MVQPSSFESHAHTSVSSHNTAVAVPADTVASAANAASPEGAPSAQLPGATGAIQGKGADEALGLDLDTQPEALHSEQLTVNVPGKFALCTSYCYSAKCYLSRRFGDESMHDDLHVHCQHMIASL